MVANLINPNHQKIILAGQVLYVSQTSRGYCLRRLHESDYKLLIEMFLKLSADTLQKRFMRPYFKIDVETAHEYVSHLWIAKAEKQYIVLATVRERNREHAIAIAELLHSGKRTDPAEIALVVRDDYQRDGVGSKLVLDLAQAAQARGITHWHADASIGNEGVRRLLQKSGRLYKSITR